MASKSASVLPRPRPGTPPVPAVPIPERLELANGLRVAIVRRSDLPQVFGRLVIPAGSAADPPRDDGAASLAGSLILEGTTSRSPIELHERIDQLGAALHSRVGHDFAEVDVSLLSETLEEGLALLAEVVAQPSFPEREVERLRAETLDALEARLDEPANVADDRAGEAVFGPDHPYGRLTMGTPESVERLDRDALINFHRRRYRPRGSVLVIAGDLGADDLRPLLERTFGRWTGDVRPIDFPDPILDCAEAGSLATVEWPDAAQAEIRFAGPGLARADDDWIPATIANYILGGSTITGRLGANLREDKGWTYGVRCGFAAGLQPGGWVIETAVDGSVAADALAEIEAELARLIAEGSDDDELERAKEALILSLPRAFETPGRIVSRIATVEAYGLPLDYWESYPRRIQQVDAAAVGAMAERYFSPDRLARVAVGPPLHVTQRNG